MTQPNASGRAVSSSSDDPGSDSPTGAASTNKGGTADVPRHQSPPRALEREMIDLTAASPVRAPPKVFSMFERGPKATSSSSSSSSQVEVELTNKRKANKKAGAEASSSSSKQVDEPSSSSKRQRRTAAIAADAASASQANAFQLLKQASKAQARSVKAQVGKSANNPLAVPDDEDQADDDQVEIVASHSTTLKSKDKKKVIPTPPPLPAAPPLKLQVRGTGCAPSEAHSFFAKRAPRPQLQGTSNSVVHSSPLATRITATANNFKPQLEAAWPSRDLLHVQPWREPELALPTSEERQMLRATLQAGFQAASGTLSANGKGKARQESDNVFVELAQKDSQSRSQGSLDQELTTQPPQLKRGQARDILPSFIASSVALSDVRATDGALPGAIEHLRRLALREGEDEAQAGAATVRADLWITRYKPRTASQCLGNEIPATSLRDWLSELKVSTKAAVASEASSTRQRGKAAANATSKPAVQKRVKKQKGRHKKAKRATDKYGFASEDSSDGLDDFIVDTTDEEEEAAATGWFSRFRPGLETDGAVEDELMAGVTAQGSSSSAGGLQQLLHNAISGVARPSSSVSTPLTLASPAPSSTALPEVSRSGSSNAWSRIPALPTASAQLTNCILLTGPSGGGKTAALYACAAELGYEVFELFAGMRRRAGKDVSSAVGDLGRNHMVGAGGAGGGAFGALMRGAAAKAKEAATSTEPRQSLILLEEVDLLFEEDKGFWPAVVELVAESRRPVVLTCNDLAMVPLADLPIQSVLHFAAPSPHLAVPYLQLVALVEGHQLSAAPVTQLYTTTAKTEEASKASPAVLPPDGPLNPYAELISSERATLNTSLPAYDLRAALMQLQFACQRKALAAPETIEEGWCVDTLVDHKKTEEDISVKMERSEATPINDLKQLKALRTLAETQSFIDAVLARSFQRESDMYEPEQYGPSTSDVQQQAEARQLWKTFPFPHGVALPQYGREEELKEALLEQAVAMALESHAPLLPSFERLAYDTARLEQSRSLWTLVAAEQPAPWCRAPHQAIATMYAPFMRAISTVDDAQQSAHETSIAAARKTYAVGTGDRDATAPTGRATRNSLRLGVAYGSVASRGLYERYFVQGPLELAAARFTALEV